MLVRQLGQTRRGGLPNSIVWESRAKTSQFEWLELTSVTPEAYRADWHRNVSYTITAKQNGKDDVSQTVEYGKELGVVKATYGSNTFEVSSSQVDFIRIIDF